MDTQKVCTKCKKMKDLAEYHNLKTGVMGKHSNCKQCRNEYRKVLAFKKPISGKLKCEQCNLVKHVREFYKDRSKSTGVQSYCILCQKEKVYESASKLNTYIKTQLLLLKNDYIKNKSIDSPINLSTEDIIEVYNNQNKECALTKELLTYYSGKCLTYDKYEKKFNMKIVKKDNLKPFTKDNIILVGNIVYKMIGNNNLNEFKRLCKLICDS
jgi:hypothetical protein